MKLYCPLEAGVLCLGSIKLTFYARRSKRLKSCSVKDNSATWNDPEALPSLVNVLSSVLGNPVRQWNPWSPVPSTEASPQMQGRTHGILFWHEASHLQTGCPGNSFFQMWAIRWQMWLSVGGLCSGGLSFWVSEYTVNTSLQMCVGKSQASFHPSLQISSCVHWPQNPGLWCKVVRNYNTRKSRVMIHAGFKSASFGLTCKSNQKKAPNSNHISIFTV